MNFHDIKIYPDPYYPLAYGERKALILNADQVDKLGLDVGDVIRLTCYVPTPDEWKAQMGDAEYPRDFAPRTVDEMQEDDPDIPAEDLASLWGVETGDSVLVRITDIWSPPTNPDIGATLISFERVKLVVTGR